MKPYPSEYDKGDICDLCNKMIDYCLCYCEVCDTYGDPNCIVEHGLKVDYPKDMFKDKTQDEIQNLATKCHCQFWGCIHLRARMELTARKVLNEKTCPNCNNLWDEIHCRHCDGILCEKCGGLTGSWNLDVHCLDKKCGWGESYH